MLNYVAFTERIAPVDSCSLSRSAMNRPTRGDKVVGKGESEKRKAKSGKRKAQTDFRGNAEE